MTARLIQLRHTVRRVTVQLFILATWLILQDCPTLGQQLVPLSPSSPDPRQVRGSSEESLAW